MRRRRQAEKPIILSEIEIDNLLLNIKDKTKIELVKIILKKVKLFRNNCWIFREDWSIYSSIDGKPGHRVFFELFKSQIVNNNFVCHHCDIKGCINPEHLFQGTSSDNTQDWIQKYRNFRLHRYLDHVAKNRLGLPIKEIKSWRDSHDIIKTLRSWGALPEDKYDVNKRK
ncbi:MAG: HNH endonuclease [Nitrososphaeraceae archaeon]